MVPTLWIVLGPLGQSITATNLLGEVAHLEAPGGRISLHSPPGAGTVVQIALPVDDSAAV